ncbi:Glucans biosynthesis protein G precursor [Roseovarius litorisediminis]|uniref:Glucans biosynthesis protein G n=1 Tax=Roseovarius litorisediminis TaxID=1312363 RepID=A0A1Y5SKH0_9RHOB|nr:glucan biosynthesis protein G [Roseovarius litorisediminis]SLN42530.1 Glucans biosynthesis protein G precursor [Roseovarius litorisediminis]
MKRRDFFKMIAAVAASPTFATGLESQKDEAFSEEMLHRLAQDVADMPYRDRPMVPKAMQDWSYEQYKSIWFNTSKGIWTGTESPLQVDLFHPGLFYPHPVEINLVENGRSRTLPFDWGLFDKTDKAPTLPTQGNLGFSGLRLRSELEKPEIFQEYAVFQGASYFRVIAKDLVYGLSARGLAVNTADQDGEEFPDFTRFWIERPKAGAHAHVIHALMESPSVTGLYHFTLYPGPTTEVDVRVSLFPRDDLKNVGLGPLTSMFYFDETNRGRFDDFRPAVHDSDGLSILNGRGEMIWRPLANPKQIQISSFVDENPQGFGLAQRERRFSDFADLEALYHKRPSLWISPGEDWGKGAITLVEIPTNKEIYDNIVAYWRPREPLAAGQEHNFSYRMTWCAQIPEKKPVAPVLNSRIGKGFTDNENKVVTIDFAPHSALPEVFDDITIHVSSNRLKVSDGVLQRNPETGGPRLAFSFDPGDVKSAELRAQLMFQGRSVSEVWLYRWTT